MMETVVLWLLIASGVSTQSAQPVVIAKFVTEKDCRTTAAEMQKKSEDKSFMAKLYGICVEAKVAQ